MAGVILRKTGKVFFITMKIFFYMVWLLAGFVCFLLKICLLLFVLALRLVFAVSVLSGRE